MPVYPPPASGGAGGGSVTFYDESIAVGTATILDFVGAGVTATYSGGTVTATIAGGTATGSIIVQDEGSTIGTATVVNIVGSGGTATVTISGGGGLGEYASKYNPAHETPATAVAGQNEFNGVIGTGWAWTASPSTLDLTTYPGYYAIKNTSGTNYLQKAWTPGASDITVVARIAVAHTNQTGDSSIGVGVQDATGAPGEGVFVIAQVSTGDIVLSGFDFATGTPSQVGSDVSLARTWITNVIWLRLVRAITGPVWTFSWSLDGLTWQNLGTTGSKALTVGAVSLRVDGANQHIALDLIRYWTSQVEAVGA